MQVGYGVVRHKHTENAGICFGVWVTYIAYLEIHLKGSSTFITSKFDPDFIWRNCTIVPGELIHTINITNISNYISITLSLPSCSNLACCSRSSITLSGKDGTYAMALARTSSPPLFRAKVKGAASAMMSVLTNSLERSLCFFSLAMRTPASTSHLINIK